MTPVESRLYAESMSGATAKSKPKATKIDEKELTRLRNQDYWLQITRTKLLMDLIFVCAFTSPIYLFLPLFSLSVCLNKGAHWLTNADVLFFFLFCLAYDLFHLKRGKDTIKAFAGLSAAVLR